MTLRILIALSLLAASFVLAYIGFGGLLQNDWFLEAMRLLMYVGLVFASVCALVAACVVVLHETRLTDWLKEKLG